MRFHRIPAVALALVIALVTGCEDVGSPTSADLRDMPSHDLSSDGVLSPDSVSLQLVELNWSDTVSYRVEKVFDRKGGKLKIGSHEVFVPHGAVSSPTRFVWTATVGKYVEMDLQAIRVSDGAAVTKFPEDIKLRINYGELSWMGDPDRLRVVYLVDGTPHGRKEKVESYASRQDKNVTGRLEHFSIYTMAIE